MIECLCIDDTNKPHQIPESKWVKRGKIYNIVLISIHPNQGFIQGCLLSELELDESCQPYEYYKLNRFAFREEDIPKLIEMMKNSSELDELDIKKLLEESELVIND